MTALKVAPQSPSFEFIHEVERLFYRSNLDRCRLIGESLRPLLSERGWIAPELLHQRSGGYSASFYTKTKKAPSASAALFGEPGKSLRFMTIGRGASSAYFLEHCNQRIL